MKNTSLPILATVILSLSGSFAGAAPWNFGSFRRAPEPSRHEERGDRHDDRRNDYHGNAYRGNDYRGNSHRRMSLEARAQFRLRELGYYRGPVDGDFGRRSRSALAKFQYRKGLRPTGWLDYRTQRALRL